MADSSALVAYHLGRQTRANGTNHETWVAVIDGLTEFERHHLARLANVPLSSIDWDAVRTQGQLADQLTASIKGTP